MGSDIKESLELPCGLVLPNRLVKVGQNTTTHYVMTPADDLCLGCYGRRAGREEAFTWPADFSRLR